MREIDPYDGAGQRLGGRYRLLRPLGSGGMSVVWRAHDDVLGREVAVKVLAPEAANVAAYQRIRAEAKAAARLSHPNVTSVFDYGEAKGPRGTRVPYVVMELLDGVSLASKLRTGPLPWRTTVATCAQVAAALAAAHERGVVHRDVKPANIMLTSSGAKVVDFGIAGLTGSPADHDPDEPVLGTPAYLAPERLAGEPVIAATDVYALGMLLYRCLAGRLPWQAETITQMITAHTAAPPDPLPPMADLPDEVAVLCAGCLAKDPADRPTAKQAAQTLADLAGISVTLPGPGEPGRPLAADDHADGETTDGIGVRRHLGYVRTPGPRSRTLVRVAMVGLGITGAAALVAALFLVGQPDGGPSGDDPPDLAAGACEIHFLIRPEPRTRGDFGARVVLVNTGTEAVERWTIRFRFNGVERVTEADGVGYAQTGASVTLTGTTNLPPGKAAIVGLRGSGGRPNGPPTDFTLNGRTCVDRPYDLPPGGQPWPAPTAVTDPPVLPVPPGGRRPPPADPGLGGAPDHGGARPGESAGGSPNRWAGRVTPDG